MWFAAMSDYRQHPWFVHFLAKLLENDRDVLSLLAKNPFPVEPPKFVRAEYFGYRFSTPAERAQTGQFWIREKVGEYFPPVSLATPGFHEALERVGWIDD